MTERIVARIVIALALFFAVSPTWACSYTAQTNVSFGTYDIFAITDTDAGVGSVRVRCSPQVPYTIKLSTGGAGSYLPRALASGANTLNYNLYQDIGRTQIWGDGSGGTTFLSSGSHGGQRTYSIYGRIPAGQDPAAGSYTDTITATMDF